MVSTINRSRDFDITEIKTFLDSFKSLESKRLYELKGETVVDLISVQYGEIPTKPAQEVVFPPYPYSVSYPLDGRHRHLLSLPLDTTGERNLVSVEGGTVPVPGVYVRKPEWGSRPIGFLKTHLTGDSLPSPSLCSHSPLDGSTITSSVQGSIYLLGHR